LAEFLKTIEILTFSELANTYHQSLILDHKSLAKKRLEKDMRIAAIAREHPSFYSGNGRIILKPYKI
jgi:hypothetical protein